MSSVPATTPAAVDTRLAKLFNSPTDSRVAHLNRVLATSAGVDSTLCFVGYGLGFVSGQLTTIAGSLGPMCDKMGLPYMVGAAAPAASKRLLDVASSTRVFGSLCSDVRMFMRLWGLLKIWAGAKATYFNPPKDETLRRLSWAQLGAMATYLVLENRFYLASKGVLRGWTPQQLGSTMKSAIWVFAAYLAVDYARLYRVWQLKNVAAAQGGEKEDKIEALKQEAAWWRSLQVDLAYSPLCFHWGLDKVQFSESLAGFLGACAGFVGFRENLRLTAQ